MYWLGRLAMLAAVIAAACGRGNAPDVTPEGPGDACGEYQALAARCGGSPGAPSEHLSAEARQAIVDQMQGGAASRAMMAARCEQLAAALRADTACAGLVRGTN